MIAKPSYISFIEVPSDVITSLSYFFIPFLMVYISMKRKDIPFNGIFWMFSCFIVCCGTTHFIAVFMILNSEVTMIFAAIAKFLTAAVSFITAIALWR